MFVAMGQTCCVGKRNRVGPDFELSVGGTVMLGAAWNLRGGDV